MGARGRRTTPSILKYVRGNPSKEKLPDDEPTPDLLDEKHEPPAWLNEAEAAEWRELVPVLVNMRVFTEADVLAVGVLCTYIAEMKECREKCEKLGADTVYMEPDPNNPGKMRIKHSQPSSWHVRMQQAKKAMRSFMQEYGLTASSRTAISLNASQSPNDFSAFLERRRNRAGA